jgi:peptide/nickel transport system ATP-binding protein
MAALEARQVSKRYVTRPDGALGAARSVDALKSVSLVIPEDGTFGIVGESGSGKTTLARIMLGATAADAGEIRLDGAVFRHADPRQRRRMTKVAQMVPQDSASSLNPLLTLTDSVAFGLWGRGQAWRAARRAAEAALDRVGLPPGQFGRRRPSEISGGQRQRVNLARAIVLAPRILFLDEPVSALDKTVQAQILNLLVELRRDLGLTMILISHDLEVIRYLCSRTAVMRGGEIVEEGPTAEIMASPRHDYTRSLIAALPHLDAPVAARTATPGSVAASPAPPLLDVGDLRVSFRGGAAAVRGIALSLRAGEVLAVVGESGSGKSVTLRALLGLLPPTAVVSGRIAVSGMRARAGDVGALAALRGRIAGMVFQDPMGSLDPMAPIGRQLEDAVMALRKLGRRQAGAIALSLLDRVHLAAARERYAALPDELSGGQRQRVGIALALAGEPAVLFADEPTTALDVSVQARILELLRGLCSEGRIGLVLVTHDMAVAREMADRVAVMYAGRIVEEGPADAVLAAPEHPYSQALLQSYLGIRRGAVPLPMLAGAPPRMDEEARGCAFAARCPAVADRCRSLPPPSVATAARRCECFLAGSSVS